MNMNPQEVPETIKRLADDPKIYDAIEKIGDKFDLHIDQIGDLDAEVRRVILGISKPTEFIKNIAKLLEIDQDKGGRIAEEINKDVIQSIRSELQSQTSDNRAADNLSPIERAGGFEIEREPAKNASDEKARAMTETQKINMLSDIESPTPIRKAVPQGEETLKTLQGEEIRREPLVDRLLKNPLSLPEEKVEGVPERAPAARPAPKAEPPRNLPTNDLYREPV
ncbi:MAG: hypothetical protein ABSF56_01205 [Minisyncoccia bacterium]